MPSQDAVLFMAWCRAIVCIYVVASIPWRLAYCPEFSLSIVDFPGFVVADLVATVFFTYDTIILGRQKFITNRKVLPETVDVLRDQIVNKNWLHVDDFEMYEQLEPSLSWSNIFIQFVSTLPFEYISGFGLLAINEWPNYLMTNRMLRLIYLPKYINDLSTVLARRGYVKSIGVRRTWLLFFAMALAGHTCGSIFYLIGRRKALSGVQMSWPEVAGIYSVESVPDGTELKMKKTTVEAYITSLYWAYTTMVTTGIGDIVPLYINETIWCIFSIFVGVTITTLTIANLQLLVINLDASRLNFQQKVELIKKFMHYRNLPPYLQDRMLSFYEYQWTVLKGADEEKFLADLPRTLQQQVANFMCRDIIASLPILRNANNALLNALVECAEMNIYSPNDEIVKTGERPRGTILVAHGEVEVLKGDMVKRKMKRLDSFGEECLFVDKPTPFTVRSKGFSEIILIPSVHFQNIIAAQCERKDISEMREKAIAMSKSTQKANKMFGSADDVTPSNGFLKHCQPNSFFRKFWDCLVLFGHIFYIVSIPLSLMKVVDNQPFNATPVLLTLGYAVDAFFLVDTVFEFHYFMYIDEGLIVFNKDYIHKHYLQRRSVLQEAIGLFPFDLIIIFFEGRYCHCCRLLKLVRVPNILRYTESIGVMLSELKVEVDLSFVRVIKLNLVMFLVCHWVGCCWYMMALLSMRYQFDQNWIWADENNKLYTVKHSDFNGFSAYLRSVYWAIVGMSTVGYADILPRNILEITYAMVVILFGGLLLPAVVGGLAANMSNFRYASKAFQKKLSKTRRYLIERVELGEDVIETILRYYKYNWSRRSGVVDQEIMNELSTSLRTHVTLFINEGTISSVPYFTRCDDTMKQLIMLALQHQQFIPFDVIVEEGGVGKEMFFLHRGEATATVSSMAIIPFRILGSGDYFGECGLLQMSTTNSETVTATTYCECFSLSRHRFDDVLEGSSLAKDVKADIANFLLRSSIRSKRVLQNISQHSKCIRLVVESEQAKESSLTILKSRWVLLPSSPYYLTWNCVLFIACIYNAWMIPFRLAFKTSSDSYFVADWVFDIFFVLDMFVNYRFVGFSQDGEVIVNVEQIKRTYMLRRFKTDILSSFPFDFLAFLFLPRVTSLAIGLYIGDMLRVLKLLRFPRYFYVVEKVFALLQDKNVPLAPLRMVEFFGGVILIAHLAACGFFTFARWNKNNSYCVRSDGTLSLGCQWDGTWIKAQIYNGKLPADGGEVWQQYIRSFNWALPTLVMVVIGDVVPSTSPETLYVFLWIFVGVTINASIIGNIANIIANLESEQSDFATKVDEIKRYMFRHHLSYEMHSKVDDFTRYLWIAHDGSANEDDFIMHLPHSLRRITLHKRVKHIQNCPFFDICSSEIVDALSMCMRPLVFCAGHTIAHAGDMGQEMFFLERGKVIVVSSDTQSTVFATLDEGSYFGETSLFFKKPRATAVKAVTFCDVLELRKQDLFSELKLRDFNLMKMLETFAVVHENNQRRNNAIQENLQESKKKETKLSRMIDAETFTPAKKRKVLSFFMPGTRFRFLWDVLCTVSIIYFAIFTLFRLAFRPVESETTPLVPFDFVVDAFFYVDFYLRSSHFAFLEHGSIITEVASIRRHYMENGMLLDFISSASLIDVCSYKSKLIATFNLRLFCLLRVLRIPTFFNLIADHLGLRDIRIGLASNLLCRIIFFYAMANHWVACVWFIIHRELERGVKYTWATTDCPWDGDVAGSNCTSSWDEPAGKHNVCSLSMIDCYVRSLHFSLTTLSSVGYGDLSPVTELETVWENVVVLMGACFSAVIVGSMLRLLSQNDTMGANSFKTKVQKLKEYMAYRKLPPSLQNNILYFHQCRWQDSQTHDERETLSLLPEPLQLEISFAVKQRAIQLVPVLNEQPKLVQKRLCNMLTLQVYPPNSIIYSVGELGWEIYFIASGVVTIVLPADLSELDSAGREQSDINRQKFQSIGLMLGRGNHVGESCLKSESGIRQESVVAKSKVEMYVLSEDDLNNVCMFMEPSKRKAFIQLLLTKNGNCWHTFEDVAKSKNADNTRESEIDFLMSSATGRERQISGNLSSFPWSTPKCIGSVGAHSRVMSVMTQRRLSGARLRAYTGVPQQIDT